MPSETAKGMTLAKLALHGAYCGCIFHAWKRVGTNLTDEKLLRKVLATEVGRRPADSKVIQAEPNARARGRRPLTEGPTLAEAIERLSSLQPAYCDDCGQWIVYPASHNSNHTMDAPVRFVRATDAIKTLIESIKALESTDRTALEEVRKKVITARDFYVNDIPTSRPLKPSDFLDAARYGGLNEAVSIIDDALREKAGASKAHEGTT